MAEYCVVADLAFVGGARNDDRILQVLESNKLVLAEFGNSVLVNLRKKLTKLCQSTKWANNGFKQVLQRHLECKLSCDNAKNKALLELCIILYN